VKDKRGLHQPVLQALQLVPSMTIALSFSIEQQVGSISILPKPPQLAEQRLIIKLFKVLSLLMVDSREHI
jgi:hypothetical protein